jgi:signal transduction histidine kinase
MNSGWYRRCFQRLYLQIYLTVAASVVLMVLAAGAVFRVAMDSAPASHALEMASIVVSAALPPADEAAAVQQQALQRLARDLKVELALFDTALQPVAATVSGIEPPEGTRRGWWRGELSLKLSDGRWLVARMPPERRPPAFAWLAFLAISALLVALAAWPVVRRLTRRLERLQASVEALGAGELSARVRVEGHDEVAALAASFNRAAERIEKLVDSHRMLLANTSHELRTPLARIRMGVELLGRESGNDPDAKRRAELERDIVELDEMIDEILSASRLDAAPGSIEMEEVDLLGLAAEEAARYTDCELEVGKALDGAPGTHADDYRMEGNLRLLKRMIRNLLENARKYGAPPLVMIVGRDEREALWLRVRDHGPGVPASERERIFEPFYRVAGAVRREPEPGNPSGGTAAGGTGLGLALVRRIAEHHGGSASLVDVGGPGTCIQVVLPGHRASSSEDHLNRRSS